MIGDWPITKDRVDAKIYSDKHDDLYELEKNWRDAFSPVRKVNQLVVEVGEKEGVQTYIVSPPLICEFQHIVSVGNYA